MEDEVFKKGSHEMAALYFEALSRKHSDISQDSGYPNRL
jgi:hypothetical protein